MASMKPRTGDGPMEATREGILVVVRVPIDGGGRLVVEMSADEARDLGEVLLAAAVRAAIARHFPTQEDPK